MLAEALHSGRLLAWGEVSWNNETNKRYTIKLKDGLASNNGIEYGPAGPINEG
jgi:hypothetical protein